jgi:hypothetical protein
MVPEDLLFWVAPLDARIDLQGGVLCRRHADAMVVPRGWTLDDRREPAPRLFRPAPSSAPDDTGSIGRPRRRRTAASVDPAARPHQLRLADDRAATAAAADAPAVAGGEGDPDGVPPDDRAADDRAAGDVAAAVDVWRPAFDVDDDLDGLLEVDSPLLARAFRGTGRTRR